MHLPQPLAAIAQMHSHRGARIVGILTDDCLINRLMLAQHIAQPFDLIQLCDLRFAQARARTYGASHLAKHVVEVAIAARPRYLQMKLDVMGENIGAAIGHLLLEAPDRTPYLLQMLFGSPCRSER